MYIIMYALNLHMHVYVCVYIIIHIKILDVTIVLHIQRVALSYKEQQKPQFLILPEV